MSVRVETNFKTKKNCSIYYSRRGTHSSLNVTSILLAPQIDILGTMDTAV